jgi:subtilisin-like proprotein convertase family protein
MKRNIIATLVAIVLVVLACLVLPAGLVNRSEAKAPTKGEAPARKGIPFGRAAREARERSLQMSSLGLVQSPATPGPQFVSRQADAFAVSLRARDLPKQAPITTTAKMKDSEPDHDSEDGAEKVENDQVKQSIGLKSDFRPDMLLNGPAVPNAMPTPTLTFDGNTHTVANFLPPDTNGDVGPNHYVQTTNSNNTGNTTVGIYNKTTGASIIPNFGLATLFATLPPTDTCRTHDDGDPIVVYDPLADRWLISQFAIDTSALPSRQCIAISQTGDPTGAYFLYSFAMPDTGTVNDYPHFGVWPDAYYMSDNQFNDALNAFLGAGMFAFNRAKMLAGDPTANYIYFNVFPLDATAGGMLPTDFDGLVAPPAGLPQLFMEFRATEFGDPADTLRPYRFIRNFAVPASSTLTIMPDIPLAAFDANSPASRNVVEQPPPGVSLDVIADRLMWRLSYRNLGAGGGTNSWVGNFTVNVSGLGGTTAATYQGGIKWFELHTAGTTVPTTAFDQGIHSSGIISGAVGLNDWMGSVAQDNVGNLALGFSQSSTTQNANIMIAGRTSGSGTLNEGEALFTTAGGVQTSTSGRWGDYSAMSVDPADECTFWYTQEYYNATSSAIWNTRIGKFAFPACTSPQKGTVTVNVTNCDTGLPVQGASVTIDGNLYGSTLASGSYLGGLPPGTYSVTVSKPPLYSNATQNGVVITDGNNTVVNLCIVGVPLIATSGSSFTAESCGPANNTVDPGETVTVSLGLKNAGAGTTTNLVGTLQATGGVTSPSGPQTYGAIPPDNSTVVSRPFTFTVDAGQVCGSQVIATLQLQDGATDLGTVTFTYQVGTVGAAFLSSSGNIATPLPDNTTVDVPIVISSSGLVADINVRVRMNHTFDGDVSISLVAPDNTIVPLVTNRGAGGDNFGSGNNDCSGTPTVFDDSAATAISAGAPPYAGSFRPESPLSAMNGKSVNGTWKVRFNDNANLDTGIIGCVTLDISRPICCGVPGTPEIAASSPATISLENCTSNGAIDPGETVTVDLPLVNNGTAATTNLMATLQTSGGVAVVHTTNPQNYGAIIPGGGAVTRPFRFTAGALNCGDVLTATLALQDGATNLGTVSFNFTTGAIVTNSQTFSSVVPIIIPAGAPGVTSGPAAPYPSTIVVSGAPTTITGITVSFSTMNQTFPDDVDVLLVSPTGRKMIIMSDTGGTNDWVNANITLDDAAAALLSDTGANPTGTYKPSNVGANDAFAVPAPAGPYLNAAPGGTDTLTSAFTGVAGGDPNGIWSLYVVDDASGDVGNFNGGWSLTLSTSARVCCAPTAAPAFISGRVTTPDGAGLGGVTMNLSGARSARAITDSSGNYRFNNIDTDNFYTVTPALVNYQFGPPDRSFSLLANKTDAIFTATRNSVIVSNAIDTPEYFVRQHYLDFLGREPDQAGFDFWSDQIVSCGADAACIERRTINVSAAYFLSIEFGGTGGFVDGLYRASYARAPLFAEFMPDTALVARNVVVGAPDWNGILAANKQAFINDWVQRPAFQSAYGELTNEGYVDTLISHTGVAFSQSERTGLVNGLNSGNSTRADVLRQIAENETFVAAKRNERFVMMEYFGYLRRDPDEAGYRFWLNKLNQFDGNFERAEMVKAFIVSGEYRNRFRP